MTPLNFKLPSLLVCSFFLLLASAEAEDFPAPTNASVVQVASSVSSLGMNLNIRRFNTDDSITEVQHFYRELWQEEASETDFPPWIMIGRIVDGAYYNVQMQKSGNQTWGYLSVSDLPEQLENRTLSPPSGHNFPKMSGTSVIDDQSSQDPGKKGRTLLLTNEFSAKSNHNYYRNHYQKKGWRILMDEQTESRGNAYAMYATKGSNAVTIAINKVNGKTTIVANEVKRGLLR